MKETVVRQKTQEVGNAIGNTMVKGVSTVLDIAAKGLSVLSSLVKGEKKVIVKLEETKG